MNKMFNSTKDKKQFKICRIVTVPFFFINHLKSTIEYAVKNGHKVFLICSNGSEIDELKKISGISIQIIEIERDISLLKDLKSLFKLYKYFKKMDFDIIHSCTPKAGLITSLAGFLAGVPCRFHTFTGQTWMYKKGPIRWISKFCDWLITHLNTKCYADSNSQRDFLIKEGIGQPSNIVVLGHGSLSGVDVKRFNPDRWTTKERKNMRKKLNIPADAFIINFTGRLNIDKGFKEYIEAFEELCRQRENIYWIIVGPYEGEMEVLPDDMMVYLLNQKKIRMVGYSLEPEMFYTISDVFCIPSYREGFGNVVIEAGIMGMPSIATRIVGLVDSVVDGETGILVPVRDSSALTKALIKIIDDKKLRKKLGQNARKRALKYFDQERINTLIMEEYKNVLEGFK